MAPGASDGEAEEGFGGDIDLVADDVFFPAVELIAEGEKAERGERPAGVGSAGDDLHGGQFDDGIGGVVGRLAGDIRDDDRAGGRGGGLEFGLFFEVVGEVVAGELGEDKLVVRQVGVEGVDHEVAIGPRVREAVVFLARGIALGVR